MSRITHLQSGKAKPAARLTRDRETKAMDAIVKKLTVEAQRPTREEAEQAVRTLLLWAGDDPEREGLLDTPARVGRAWREYCAGYAENPAAHLSRTFHEVGGYHELVLLKDIPFQSHCEHHMAPIIGKASIAYMPTDKVVGISKLARVLHGFAQRLQVQERLTQQILIALQTLLQTKNVAVTMEAVHYCVKSRGVMDVNSKTQTTALGGIFKDDGRTRAEFLARY